MCMTSDSYQMKKVCHDVIETLGDRIDPVLDPEYLTRLKSFN